LLVGWQWNGYLYCNRDALVGYSLAVRQRHVGYKAKMLLRSA
jgi:hypothetical protein